MNEAEDAAWDVWAPFYDLTDSDRGAFIGFYAGLVTASVRSVLEVACGTGRILSAIADRIAEQRGGLAGVRLMGTDYAPEMLRCAAARDGRIEWQLADMRELGIDGAFDLAYCCFNSLQLMLSEEDLARALAAARRALAPGGRFAFDVYQPNWQALAAPRNDHLVRTRRDARGRMLEHRETYAFDEQARILWVDWTLFDAGAAARTPVAHARYGLRQYDAQQLGRLLAAAGLRVIEKYGALDGSPFTAASRKQVVVCQAA